MSHCYIKRQAIEAAPFSRASPSQEHLINYQDDGPNFICNPPLEKNEERWV
jgi:hypothetical protein